MDVSRIASDSVVAIDWYKKDGDTPFFVETTDRQDVEMECLTYPISLEKQTRGTPRSHPVDGGRKPALQRLRSR